MSLGRKLKTTIISALTLLVMLSPLSPLLFDPHQALAQPVDCGATGATMELKYDNWEVDGAVGQMHDQLSGCDSCQRYQGVLFSLPEGVTSSVLKKVRFYAGGGKASLGVHILGTLDGFYADVENYLTPKFWVPISEKEGQGKWYEVSLADVRVPSKFWVFLELENLKVAPFYDIRRKGPSWNGFNPDTPVAVNVAQDNFKRAAGDFLIRAYIVPEVTVGKGTDYNYQTIQSAIDSVSDGWNLIVYPGTYSENITVDKSLTIKSLSGPAKTVVQTSPPYSDNNVFRITASCVKLSGFTMQSATYAGRAGVRLEDASGCVVSGNVIQDNSYGIYVSEGSTGNILLENECKFNTTGVYIDGSENYVSGNRLHGNTAPIGSAVFLSSTASGNQLRFNTVTVDPGTDPSVADGPQVYNQKSSEQGNAVENWWGTDTGPSNAGGQGPAVGDTVQFDPWLAKQPVRVNTVAGQTGPFFLDSRSETSAVVVKQGAGTAFISVANFAENPQGEFRYKTLQKWIDVLLSNTQSIDEVEIRVYYTADEVAALKLKEGSLRLFWWNGQKWKVCSKSSVDKTNDFVWAKLNLKSKPTPSDLTGTMFAVGIPKGGFAWWLIPLIILIVIILLFVFRLFWVLVVKREGGYTSID